MYIPVDVLSFIPAIYRLSALLYIKFIFAFYYIYKKRNFRDDLAVDEKNLSPLTVIITFDEEKSPQQPKKLIMTRWNLKKNLQTLLEQR